MEDSRVKIAVASGKGGTGKTTISTNLAYLAARAGRSVAYADCDVLVFPELCHSCGGCQLACCEAAISEVPRPIGRVRWGSSGPLRFVDGLLNVGEAMSPPAIRAVKDCLPQDAELVFLDCPPGTSCPTIESVRGADFVLLVTEPTPFGRHDLDLAVQMTRVLNLPLGVVVNRADIGDRQVWDDCHRQQIEILAEIPEDREVARAYSQGRLAAVDVPRLALILSGLLEALETSHFAADSAVA